MKDNTSTQTNFVNSKEIFNVTDVRNYISFDTQLIPVGSIINTNENAYISWSPYFLSLDPESQLDIANSIDYQLTKMIVDLSDQVQ